METTIVGRCYRHYKGGLYVVNMLATREADLEPMVCYQKYGDIIDEDKVWVRTAKNFHELVHPAWWKRVWHWLKTGNDMTGQLRFSPICGGVTWEG